jgi:hypothetical protein
VHPSGKSKDETEAMAPADWTGPDRRAADRRDAPTRLLPSRSTPARRAGGRRDTDHSSYVDRYTKRDVALLMTIFLLNVGDAFLTMMWLERGGREANPVMDFFLDIGPTAFLVQKCIVVGFWLVILLAHKNFRFARLGLYASLVVYALLMILHFSIIALKIEPPPQADANGTATQREVDEQLGLESPAPAARAGKSDAWSLRSAEQAVARRVFRSTSE